MTRKQRAFVIEALAIGGSGLLGAFVVPTLASLHDTILLFAACFLLVGWAGWIAYFLYRMNGNTIND